MSAVASGTLLSDSEWKTFIKKYPLKQIQKIGTDVAILYMLYSGQYDIDIIANKVSSSLNPNEFIDFEGFKRTINLEPLI